MESPTVRHLAAEFFFAFIRETLSVVPVSQTHHKEKSRTAYRGGPAVSVRPVAFRPRLATGLALARDSGIKHLESINQYTTLRHPCQ
jgi:hypothetical protein